MKNITFLALFSCTLFCANGQYVDWLKTRMVTVPGSGYGFDVTSDNDQNALTTGFFNSTIDFGPGPGTTTFTSNTFNAYITKQNENGDLIWAKTIECTQETRGHSIKTDSNDNVFVCGYFIGSADFDPGPATNIVTSSVIQPFILKLDANGNFIWVKTLTTSGTSYFYSLAIDTNNDILLTGTNSGSIDFDPGPGSYNSNASIGSNCFALKLDNNGNFIWARPFGNLGIQHGRSIVTDNNNNVYLSGQYELTMDVDPSPNVFNITANGTNDGFIIKLNASGDFVWAYSMGSSNDDCIFGLDVNSNSEVYFSGWYRGTVDFDPTPGEMNRTSNGLRDIVIGKLSNSGNIVWVNSIGGANDDQAYKIAVGSDDNVNAVGYYSGNIDFDPSTGTSILISYGLKDGFVCQFDPFGNFNWAHNFGGTTANDEMKGICKSQNKLLLTGIYGSGTTSFNFESGITTHNATASIEYFTMQLSSCQASSAALNITACNEYLSPSGNYIWNSSGTYHDTITNLTGCDSVLTISLTINSSPNATVSLSGITLTSDLMSPTYQWIDCTNGNQLINGETGQSFTVDQNGSYAVIIEENGCVDTSACEIVSSVSLSELDKMKVLIYPNPSQNIVYISSADLIHEISVFDMQGALQILLWPQMNSTSIDLTKLKDGIYYMRIKGIESKEFYAKISKQT